MTQYIYWLEFFDKDKWVKLQEINIEKYDETILFLSNSGVDFTLTKWRLSKYKFVEYENLIIRNGCIEG